MTIGIMTNEQLSTSYVALVAQVEEISKQLAERAAKTQYNNSVLLIEQRLQAIEIALEALDARLSTLENLVDSGEL